MLVNQLKNSYVKYGPDSQSKLKDDELGCAVSYDQGNLQFTFEIKRYGTNTPYLDLHNDDLEEILLNYAKKIRGASKLFAKCISEAIAADNALIAEVAACDVIRKTIEMPTDS